MGDDASPPQQSSPSPPNSSDKNSSTTSPSPSPPNKSPSPSKSPPPSQSPPPPSKSSPSPPPPSPPPSDSSGGQNNDGGQKKSPHSPPTPSQSPPPSNDKKKSPSPPDQDQNSSPDQNNQSPGPPNDDNQQAASDQQSSPDQDGNSSTWPPFSPPPPPTTAAGQTPSAAVPNGASTANQTSVPVLPGTPTNGSSTTSPNKTPSSPKDSSRSLPKGSSFNSGHSPSSSSSSKILIIGGVVGGFVMLFMVMIGFMCLKRKKRKNAGLPPYGWEQGFDPQGKPFWKTSSGNEKAAIAMKIPGTPPGYAYTTPQRRSAGSNLNYDSGVYSQPGMSSPTNKSPNLTLGFSKSSFTYDELAAATHGFDKANVLGQGGFGYVHKGVLPNGKEIAVKCLKSGSGQGEREFQAEVDIISRVHHRHLVSLVGYCTADQGQRMLVYEFVSNNTLEYHLHKKGGPPLDFSTRLRIALGSAKGLSYLHEDCHPRIIHRDIKASNILLDENYEAMVADFGLAKLTTDTNTHVSTRVMGTFGYLAPEYAASGKLTEKSDVFSFGVMLLELITGSRPVDPNMKYMEDSLVDWARPVIAKALDTGNFDEIADPRLEGKYNPQELQRMVACAAASIRHSARKRPKMSQIVRVLEGDVSLEDLNEGVKPGQSSIYGSTPEGSDYDSRQYSADLKRFRQMAFASSGFPIATSEYEGNTSEYGLNPSDSSSESSREMTK